MTQIDQFESIFRAASKSVFEYEDWELKKIVVVCDGDQDTANLFCDEIKNFVSHAFDVEDIEWTVIAGSEFTSVDALIKLVEAKSPCMICSHRNLHIPSTEYPYSLGVYIDVLTQVADAPVLLLPHPDLNPKNVTPGHESKAENTAADPQYPSKLTGWHSDTKRVMAITDHLDDDLAIVKSAFKMTADSGTLFLAHIEDERAYQRYMKIIEKVPEIDSDLAHEKVLERLLLEPMNFIESCRSEVAAKALPFNVEPIVQLGHGLAEYKKIVAEKNVDLVVMHTKDNDQLAMHGLAYPLTIELRSTPLLLI